METRSIQLPNAEKKLHLDVMKINGYTKRKVKEEQKEEKYKGNVLKKRLERSEGWTRRRNARLTYGESKQQFHNVCKQET
jgi:hypothetical protein